MSASRTVAARYPHPIQALVVVAIAWSMVAQVVADEPPLERVYYDDAAADGRLSGGWILKPRPDLGGVASGTAAAVVILEENGATSNRIDLVYVGDGYRADQMATFSAHVSTAVDSLFGQEPFATYRPLFNLYEVHVVSNEAGVDNDPMPGVDRDTALDMSYWCNNLERLLCVDVAEAWAFAGNAPGVDHVLAVANSSKYGGAGYASSDLATFAGAHPFGPEVATHELGHSLGNLADEYFSGIATWTGPEHGAPNVSILDGPEMAQSGTKWAAWLGDNIAGFGGTIGTYEGAAYHPLGIHRPTVNSKMRSLGQPFNLPSIEAFITEFYRLVQPIDDSTPLSAGLQGFEQVFVNPVDPVGQPLHIQWFLDGEPIDGANGTIIDLDDVAIADGPFQLSVTVRDTTWMVRDEALRQELMTQTLVWEGSTGGQTPCGGDITGDGFVGIDDVIRVIFNWGTCNGCDSDVNGDGVVNGGDLGEIFDDWGSCL